MAPEYRVLTTAGKYWRGRAAARLRRRAPINSHDLADAMLVDPVADLLLALRCEGFSFESMDSLLATAMRHARADWNEEAGPRRDC